MFLIKFKFLYVHTFTDSVVPLSSVLVYASNKQFLDSILKWFKIWMHYMDSNKTAGEEARRQLHKNAASNLVQVLAATPHKTPTVRPPASYHENYSS